MKMRASARAWDAGTVNVPDTLTQVPRATCVWGVRLAKLLPYRAVMMNGLVAGLAGFSYLIHAEMSYVTPCWSLSVTICARSRSREGPPGDRERRRTVVCVRRRRERRAIVGDPARCASRLDAWIGKELNTDQRLVDVGWCRHRPLLVLVAMVRCIVVEVVGRDDALEPLEALLLWGEPDRLLEGAVDGHDAVVAEGRPPVAPGCRNQRRDPTDRIRVAEEETVPVDTARVIRTGTRLPCANPFEFSTPRDSYGAGVAARRPRSSGERNMTTCRPSLRQVIITT